MAEDARLNREADYAGAVTFTVGALVSILASAELAETALWLPTLSEIV